MSRSIVTRITGFTASVVVVVVVGAAGAIARTDEPANPTAPAAISPAPAAAPAGFDRSIARLNRVYKDIAGDFAPIDVGPATVTLSSSHQVISVRDNHVRIVPAANGLFQADALVDFLGKGDVVADVLLGSVPERLQDELLLPPQKVAVAATMKIERVDGGYRITPTTLPKTVRVTIASRITNQILDLCSRASLLTLGSLSCDGLEESLTHPEIPVPPPGTPYLLSNDDLTAEDRAAFDALLAPPGSVTAK